MSNTITILSRQKTKEEKRLFDILITSSLMTTTHFFNKCLPFAPVAIRRDDDFRFLGFSYYSTQTLYPLYGESLSNSNSTYT
ncbi:hypothetical protein TNIN_9041 [Trichonephila inaurata madagascariensis]|uniref:Uncharacterized protein n=1 Tax=Trichonephila inaurata madagascariensis TaxID=2747483 RepID=A0A8X6YL63_9ARAC|nr:hypothetical protein TNIN_9041 [Trichonephila inaurata madagascariensis]